MTNHVAHKPHTSHDDKHGLTPNERQLRHLVAQGYTRAQIAEKLRNKPHAVGSRINQLKVRFLPGVHRASDDDLASYANRYIFNGGNDD